MLTIILKRLRLAYRSELSLPAFAGEPSEIRPLGSDCWDPTVGRSDRWEIRPLEFNRLGSTAGRSDHWGLVTGIRPVGSDHRDLISKTRPLGSDPGI